MFQLISSQLGSILKFTFSKPTDKQKIGENSYGNFQKSFSKLFLGHYEWELWQFFFIRLFPYHLGFQNMFQLLSSQLGSILKFTFSKPTDKQKIAGNSDGNSDFFTFDQFWDHLKGEIWQFLYITLFPHHSGFQNMFWLLYSLLRSTLKFAFSRTTARQKFRRTLKNKKIKIKKTHQ